MLKHRMLYDYTALLVFVNYYGHLISSPKG